MAVLLLCFTDRIYHIAEPTLKQRFSAFGKQYFQFMCLTFDLPPFRFPPLTEVNWVGQLIILFNTLFFKNICIALMSNLYFSSLLAKKLSPFLVLDHVSKGTVAFHI